MAAALLLAAAGCSVTRIVAKVDQNPLKQVAEKAAAHYSVTWVDDSTLKLRDGWFWHSVLAIGYSAFRADLHYGKNELEGTFYLKSHQFLMWWWPFCLDTSGSFVGAALKPAMRTQMHEILDWAGVAKSDRQERYISPP
jgi:hypothetical protein